MNLHYYLLIGIIGMSMFASYLVGFLAHSWHIKSKCRMDNEVEIVQCCLTKRGIGKW